MRLPRSKTTTVRTNFIVFSVGGFGQTARIALQGRSNLAKHGECDVPLTTLDTADVATINPAFVGQVFLRKAQRLPRVADALA